MAIFQFQGKWYILICPKNRVIHILGCLSLSDQKRCLWIRRSGWISLMDHAIPQNTTSAVLGQRGPSTGLSTKEIYKHREKHKTSDYSPRQIFSCPLAFVDYGNDSDQMRVLWCYSLNAPILGWSNTNSSRMVSFHKYHEIAEATW